MKTKVSSTRKFLENPEPPINIIEESYATGYQSNEYVCTVKIYDKKCRITIDRDSYDKQSSAIIKVWDGNEWKFLESIHYSNMAAVRKTTFGGIFSESDKHYFMCDRNSLIYSAYRILGDWFEENEKI